MSLVADEDDQQDILPTAMLAPIALWCDNDEGKQQFLAPNISTPTNDAAALATALLEMTTRESGPAITRVIDIGCGDGHFLSALLNSLSATTAAVSGVGIDIDEDAIASAKKHLSQSSSVAGRCDFLAADVCSMTPAQLVGLAGGCSSMVYVYLYAEAMSKIEPLLKGCVSSIRWVVSRRWQFENLSLAHVISATSSDSVKFFVYKL